MEKYSHPVQVLWLELETHDCLVNLQNSPVCPIERRTSFICRHRPPHKTSLHYVIPVANSRCLIFTACVIAITSVKPLCFCYLLSRNVYV